MSYRRQWHGWQPPGYEFAHPFQYGYPQDPNEAVRVIGQLEIEAEYHTNSKSVFNIYDHALSICTHHGFTHRAAKIHCKRAELAFQIGDMGVAMDDADRSIDKDPDYLKGYHWSAVARHRCYKDSGTYTQTFAARAVQDYVTYYRKTSSQKKESVIIDLCTAIMLAVDSGNTSILKLITFLKQNECTSMVLKLVSLKTCSCRHIQFVVMKTGKSGSGIALDVNCNLSELTTSSLFEKSDIDVPTLEAMLKLGAKVTPKSIEKAVKRITDNKLLILEFVLSACDPILDDEVLTSLCTQALALNKLQLSNFLIKQGAKPASESVIKAVDTRNPHEGLVSFLLSTPFGCVCLLKHAINKSAHELVETCLGGSAVILSEEIDLGNFLRSSKDLLCNNLNLLKKLLEIGVKADGLNDSIKPIDVVLALPKDFQHKSELVCILADNGADLTKATYPRENRTTIFHIATEIAIEQDNPHILEKICSCYQFPEDFDSKSQATNKDGQTPYHLIMQRKQSDLTIRLCEILSNHPINPSLSDNHGKRPADFKNQKFKGDKRVPILTEAAQKFQAEQSRRKAKGSSKSGAKKGSGKSGRKKVSPKETSVEHLEVVEDPSHNLEEVTAPDLSVNKSDSKENQQIENPHLRELKDFMDVLSEKPSEYFDIPIGYARQASVHKSKVKPVLPESGQANSVLQPSTEKNEIIDRKVIKDDVDDADSDVDEDDILANFDDDSLKWEVEFPEKVVKYFKRVTSKKTLHTAIKKIKRLALGIPTKNFKLCKRLKGVEELYETRVTDAVRILWEVAYQFSPTLTSKLRSSENLPCTSDNVHYIYSEVIRIWDIVEDHDNLKRSIQRIKSCRQRGEQASSKVPLLPSAGEHSSAGHCDDIRYPQVFTNIQLDDETKNLIAKQVFCCPAGSAKDDEFNVITFYPFDSSFVKSILEGEDARRDFPYKEWPKEHDIINMESRSILLLGRSGTGKTTCCLYRLWNCFQNYWSKANQAGPLMDARPLKFYDTHLENDKSESDDENSDPQHVPLVPDSPSNQCKPPPSEAVDLPAVLDSDDEPEVKSKLDLEHLHQVFITKNYVLCAQMKKRFYDLAAGNDVAKEHMAFEDAERSTSLSKVNDLAYPLFLTAREFFLLLDNSLEDDKAFFARDSDGKLTEKIHSSDYDHEDQDTLLDLDWESEQEDKSESESSDDESANPQTVPKVKQSQRREVTASYFVEKIWPSIHHVCEDKKTDPLLVWMEIKSFIKGSRQAIESKAGYLTQAEYEELGKKMAANFAGNRQEVYKLFEKYEEFIKHKAEENLFDECNFVHNIFKRLCEIKALPFSIHSFYVDEVQDFTQAELSILLRCCKDPNNLFLTGDTAQSIMRGVSFRFNDLRSLFYKANKQVKKTRKKEMVTVPIVDELTINFRSHSGVLQLAASVIDVLQKFFPNSFDRLPGDEGMFPGPIPTLLDSCNFSDLAIVLRGNKRESSAIEFGAHQVIIVQSEDAKRALPNELQAGIALTVFEAKGLEFDDVLLYDFFKDSKVSKEWRIVTTFIESCPELLDPQCENDGFEGKPRRLKFDEQHHKSLSAELKYLYTAITRAKCNLWIYDSDEKDRLPMFDYWHRRGLVKIIRLNEISCEDESVLFAATSSKEEWKKQGDYFRKKKLWEPAMKCYVKAEEVYFEKEAKAYHLVQQARAPNLRPRETEELYLKAGLAFLGCDKSKHDVKSLRYAASFLKKAKRPNEAGFLYAKLNRHKDAIREFKKCKNFMGLVQLKEEEGKYNDAVSLLVENDRRDEALKCAQQYENEGHILQPELLASKLANKYAKMCLHEHAQTQKIRNRLVKLVDFMSDPMDRVYYLKIAKKHRNAFTILCKEGRFDEAYRICAAQGWVEEGLKVAEKKKNYDWTLRFIFQSVIISHYKDVKVDESIVPRLHLICKSSNDDQIKAKANLLLGKSERDFFSCRRAFNIYLSTQNAAGCVEGFNLMIQFRMKDNRSTAINIKQILETCGLASDLIQLLNCVLEKRSLTEAQQHKLTLLENFYGLQKHISDQEAYFLTPMQHIWVEFYSGSSNCDTDNDGMIKIDSTRAVQVIEGHIQEFLERWKKDDELQVCQMFRTLLHSYHFQKQLEDEGGVKQSFTIKYQARQLDEYIQLCTSGIELSEFGIGEIKSRDIVQLLICFFKPMVAVYLGVTKEQMERLAKCSCASMLEQHSVKIVQKVDRDFRVDDWLEAWTMLSILGKNHLLRKLDKRKPKSLSAKDIPSIYKYSRDEGVYIHVFSLWIRSCFLIQKEKRVITSSKVMLHYFLHTIIRDRKIRQTLSITNLVNILTIHTTALLSLTALCNFLQHKPSNILFPFSFERVLNVFDNIGKLANGDCIRILDACINDESVLRAHDKMKVNPHAVQNIQYDIIDLLWQILDFLLGRRSQYSNFHALENAMRSEVCIKRGDTRHCLLLSLVLLGNLTEIDNRCTPSKIQSYHQFIVNTFMFLKDANEECQTLRKAFRIFSSSSNSTGFFLAIHHLITTADPHDHIIRINAKKHPFWKYELERARISQFPAHPLLPTKIQPAQIDQHRSRDNNTLSGISDKQAAVGVQVASSQVQLEKSSNPSKGSVSSLEQAINSQVHQSMLYPESHTVHSTSNTPAYSVPSDIREATSEETSTNNSGSFSPPNTTLFTGSIARLESQTSVEPQEEEEFEGNFEEADEELKHLPLAAPFVLDRQLSENEGEQSNTIFMNDTSMLDDNFCRYCSVALISNEPVTTTTEHDEGVNDEHHKALSSEEQDEQVLVEPYTLHCNSAMHVNNKKAYDVFTTLKRDFYDPLREKLLALLQEMKMFENEHLESNLRITIQDIDKELGSNENFLSTRMLAGKWKMAASQIEFEMQGRMDSIITAAEGKLSKERARIIQREQHLHEQAASGATSTKEDEEMLDDEDGSQSEEEISRKLDPQKVKEKERQRKKNRKTSKRNRK